MRFRELAIPGANLVEIDRAEDERGFFARIFSPDEFQTRNLVAAFPQVSLSHNRLKGTIRGMHFQVGAVQETKLVRCVAGAVFDVIVDLRKGSPTYLNWVAAELTAEGMAALYIPAGCAHGFQTLRDRTELLYMIDAPYSPTNAKGLRWNDPAVNIAWPGPPVVISERDRSFADWTT